MTYEMQVLEPSIPVQYADKFKWLTKSKPKLIEDKDGFPFIDYKGKQSSGLASGSEQGVVQRLVQLVIKRSKRTESGFTIQQTKYYVKKRTQ